jgi:hypothetical protein
MYAEDLRHAQATFGMILTQIYGLGETPMTVTYLPASMPAREAIQLASVGTAHPNVELRLLDQAGAEVQRGSATLGSGPMIRFSAGPADNDWSPEVCISSFTAWPPARNCRRTVLLTSCATRSRGRS